MSDNAYSKERLKRSLWHFIFGRGLAVFMGVALLLLLVRFLPSESYGQYIALAATLEIVQLCSSFGLLTIAYRYLPQILSTKQYATLKSFSFKLIAWRVVTLVIGILLTLSLTFFLQKLGWTWWPWQAALVFSLVILFEGTARFIDVIFDSLLLQGFSQLSIFLRNGLRLAGLCWAIFFLRDGYEISPLLLWICIEFAASGIGTTLATFLLMRHLKMLARTQEVSAKSFELNVYQLQNFILPSFVAQVIGLAQGPDAVKIIFFKMAGAAQAGAFGFAASIHAMLQRYLPVFLLIGVIRPMFVAKYQNGGNIAQLSAMASMVFKLNLMALIPLIICTLLLAPDLVPAMTGFKLQGADIYLQILILLLVLQTAHTVLGLVLTVVEDGWTNIKACVVGLFVFTLGIIFAWHHSNVYLAMAMIGAEIAWCSVVVLSLLRRGFSLAGMWCGYIKLFLAGFCSWAVGYVCLLTFTSSGSILLTALVSAGIVLLVFVILAALFKPFTHEERERINALLPKPIFVW